MTAFDAFIDWTSAYVSKARNATQTDRTKMLDLVSQSAVDSPLLPSADSRITESDSTPREAALHTFALFGAGVVHEINNPLAIALLSVQVALRSLPNETDLRTRHCLERAVESIQTTAAAVRDMVRDCSRTRTVHSPFDVRHVLRFVTLVMQPHAHDRGCEIEWRLSPHESLVSGNPIELEIALASLIYRVISISSGSITISSVVGRDSVSIQLEYEQNCDSVSPPAIHDLEFAAADAPQTKSDSTATCDSFFDMFCASGAAWCEVSNEFGGTYVTISLPRCDT